MTEKDMAPEFLNSKEIELLKRTLLAEFTEDEKESFIRTCQRTHLDPFTRPPQIYATRRFQKVYNQEEGGEKKIPTLVIITSIGGATSVADRTGFYDGCELAWCAKDSKWRSEWLEDEPPAAARAIVFHKQRAHPEVAVARWKSYKGEVYDAKAHAWVLTSFWKKMDDFMLAKCARMAALRGAFPNQLGGIYLSEELESNLTDSDSRDLHFRSGKVMNVESIKTIVEDPEKEELKAERAAEVAAGVEDRAKDQSVEDDIDLGPAPADAEAWKDHVITSIKLFAGRRIGDLTPLELEKINDQWMPKVAARRAEASEAQLLDAANLEIAIGLQKLEKSETVS